jgi:broad-specificity NMP kinase
VRRVLITGMSGTGKSSVISALAERGYKAIDTDYGDFFVLVESDEATRLKFGGDKEWRWREDRISALLDEEDAETLFVCGTASNQTKFYPRFDRIVMLTAPDVVILERMATRSNNPYGQDPADRERQLALKPIVEPMLRRAAHAVIDTTAPLDVVVASVLKAAL